MIAIPDSLPVIGWVIHTRRTKKKGAQVTGRTPLKYLCPVDAKAHRKARMQVYRELQRLDAQEALRANIAPMIGAAFA